MKRIVFLFFVALFSFVPPAFGQKGFNKTIPPGVKKLSPDETNQAIALAKTANRSVVENKTAASSTNPPMFAIPVKNSWEFGLTAVGMQTGKIPAGTTVIGCRTYPGREQECLQGWYFPEDYEAEWGVWYPLDNQRKALYNETGGIVRFEIFTFGPSGVKVYAAERLFNDYGPRQTKQFVDSHKVVFGGSSIQPELTFNGRFSGKVGVIITDPEIGYEIYIPDYAITPKPNKIVVDLRKLEWFPEGPADYVITVVDQTGNSDSYPFRVNDRSANLRVEAEETASPIVMTRIVKKQ